LSSLPTPLSAANATGLLMPRGGGGGGGDGSVAPSPAALRAKAWFNYLLDADCGADAASRPEAAYFLAADAWKNSLLLPRWLRSALPHVLASWLRNMLAGWVLYFGVGGAWAAVIYWLRAEACFPRGAASMPSWAAMRAQMAVSAQAMVLYTLAPTVGEWAIERGWTRAYADPAAAAAWLGLPAGAAGAAAGYAATLALYLLLVEWGIYWIHRYLHENRTLYRALHRVHHIYNNEGSLSPFAGLAFHPIDGLLQAAPYGLLLPLLPVHFWTYEALLFFTAIWTTNIHDTLVCDTLPIMGSAYHTVHHTTYRDNYGQLLVFFDWIHDTLTPIGKEGAHGDAAAEADQAAAAAGGGEAAGKAAAEAPARRRSSAGGARKR
jgi:lathosterol oxidase